MNKLNKQYKKSYKKHLMINFENNSKAYKWKIN